MDNLYGNINILDKNALVLNAFKVLSAVKPK